MNVLSPRHNGAASSQAEYQDPDRVCDPTYHQAYEEARRCASDAYSQGWAVECATTAVGWLSTYSGEALPERFNARLQSTYLIATAPYGAHKVYQAAKGAELGPDVYVRGVFVTDGGNDCQLIAVDDQSDGWQGLAQAEQRQWIDMARAYRPDAEPDLLQRTAKVLARDELLRSAVYEEVVHSTQDLRLPSLAKEVLARYFVYQMPKGSAQHPPEVINCFRFVDQLAVQYGRSTILRLNFGTLSTVTLREELIKQMCEAAHNLFRPMFFDAYAAHSR